MHPDECDLPGLPVACQVLRYLEYEGYSKKAALLRCEQDVYGNGQHNYIAYLKE